MANKHKHTNALIDSESPYLLQHAHNPVNWMPWSEQTWAQALELRKPVIVSIGYSTCHWCHVMERESFEDEVIAALMNENFICIKVDREERPDVDMLYMDSCQLMTGRGGWPLNAICMPDKRPIYAGTYFPRENWKNVLKQIADLWQSDQPKMQEYAVKIEKGIRDMNLLEFPAVEAFNREDLVKISENLISEFDVDQGGLNRGQKFPMPVVYEYLLDQYLVTGNKHILDFVNFTLLKMANGGIYDHLRGGFYRYATDRYWFAPHFEKMLYDNAQLVSLYSRAYAITGADPYKNVVVQTLDFLFREMRNSEGAFYSALDADSEGIEGRFYVFTWSEMLEVLHPEELEIATLLFGVTEKGNWEHGFNILHKPNSPLQLIEKSGLTVDAFREIQLRIQSKLFALQDTRIRPGLDSKIIASWNALMVKALADAGKFLNSELYIEEAQRTAESLLSSMFHNKYLLRTHSKSGHVNEAFSEDYACFIHALVGLFEADGDEKWLHKATELFEVLESDFLDKESGMFTFTSLQKNPLVLHKTDTSDDVIPASNSMLSMSLQKLGMLMEKTEMVEAGARLLEPMRYQVAKNMPWYSNWGRAAQLEAIGMLQVVVNSKFDNTELEQLQKAIPSWAIFLSADESDVPLAAGKQIEGQKRVYVCLNQTCFEPVESIEKALEIISDVLY